MHLELSSLPWLLPTLFFSFPSFTSLSSVTCVLTSFLPLPLTFHLRCSFPYKFQRSFFTLSPFLLPLLLLVHLNALLPLHSPTFFPWSSSLPSGALCLPSHPLTLPPFYCSLHLFPPRPFLHAPGHRKEGLGKAFTSPYPRGQEGGKGRRMQGERTSS